MGDSKKAQIAEYYHENPEASSTVIADEFDTTPGYARRCKPEELRGNTQNAPARDIAREQKESDESEGTVLAGLDGEPDDEPDEPDENPLASLVIEDTHDEYECADCGAAVEYLDGSCSACGEELVWARGVAE